MSPSTRWLVAVAAVVAIAVVAGTLISVASDDEQDFAAGTPERAVQDYLRAIAERDVPAVEGFISAELHDRCGDVPRDIVQRNDYRFRAALEDTVVRADVTEIHVALTETYGSPPFGGGESTWTVIFELAQEDGAWRFTETPWPLYCAKPRMPAAVPVPAS